MPRFNVRLDIPAFITASICIEAEDERAAVEKAKQRWSADLVDQYRDWTGDIQIDDAEDGLCDATVNFAYPSWETCPPGVDRMIDPCTVDVADVTAVEE